MATYNKINGGYCQYCWPIRRKFHYIFHLEYYLSKLIFPFVFFEKVARNNRNCLRSLVFDFLSLLKMVRFISEPDETKLYNRSLIFLKEARKRNLDVKAVKFLGKYINEFKFVYQEKRYYYEGVPLTIGSQKSFEMDDKNAVKILFQRYHLPVARGKIFTNPNKAIEFGKKLGYPLVVKPNSGSLSCHVACPIDSDEKLSRAIRIARIYKPDFIVEKYIRGNLYRASVIAKKHVFVCQKDRANIVGDGYSTVQTLIEAKNNNKIRGETDQMNTTLHKIPLDNLLKKNLQSQGLDLKSVLSKNKKVYLQDKFILSQGCDIINCQDIHPANKELFLKIADILKTDLVGIDFICPDISKSYQKQESAILEANSLPYVDMHQYPSHGQSYPVAELVWDIVLNNLNPVRSGPPR